MTDDSATTASPRLDDAAVRSAYSRWAPIYDLVFRGPLYFGRRAAVETINTLEGHVLEAGVGTGMSLPRYKDSLTITGIDLSEDMLRRARERAANLPHVLGIQAMDAGDMGFPDDHFDVTVAMYLLPVVPDPARVMRELERVTRPGGTVIVVNHFSAEGGLRGYVERQLERFSDRLGWNPEFPIDRVLGVSGLVLQDTRTLAPFGLFTQLTFRKPDTPRP